MTSTTAAAFLPTIWSKDVRKAIEYEEVLPALCNTKYEAELSVGRTIQIPIDSNLNTQTKTEGVSNTITFQSMAGTTGSGTNYQAVTVSVYEYAAQLLNVVVEAQSKYSERQRISHKLGYSLMRGVEVTIAALPQNFSQIVGTLGADPTEANMRRAWQYLADAGVKSNAHWVFGPAAISALLANDKFTSKDFVNGKSAIETAQLSEKYGFPIYRSNLLRAPATGQTECFLAHREALILIRQIRPTVKTDYIMRNNADGIMAFDLYNAVEAIWSAEAPTGDSDPTVGDYGAVLIRSA
jgi:hypothetical protein